ncbi:MAG: hypothetical protein ABGW87_12420 [Sphingomonadaceae bacterium]
MSDLSRYRKSVVIFSVGVIGLVSLVFDGDKNPSMIESEAQSLAHHGNAQPDAGADHERRLLFVSGNSSVSPETDANNNLPNDAQTAAANPWAIDSADARAAQPDIARRPDPLPDNIIVYK